MNDPKPNNRADAVIQNIGAAAEATALFYNTIVKQVPANVALELTKQYMAVVFQPNRTTQVRIPNTVLQTAIQKAAEEARKKQEQAEKPLEKQDPPEKPKQP